MGILERSKVKLRLALDRDVLCPGEALTGTVTLTAHEAITFRSLWLRVLGRESAELLLRRDLDLDADSAAVDYVSIHLTFTGPCSGKVSHETQTYEAGEYTYPFRIELPLSAPPSYAAATSSGCVRVAYTVTAVLSIPGGFDCRKAASFRVAAAVSTHQLQETNHVTDTNGLRWGRRLPQVSRAAVYRHAWGRLRWGKRKDEEVVFNTVVSPSVVVMGEGNQDLVSGEERMTEIGVRLAVNNKSDLTLPAVSVTLANAVRLYSGQYDSFSMLTVAKTKLQDVNIPPRSARDVDLILRVAWKGFRTSVKRDIQLPVPSMRTASITSTYVLLVSFPGSPVARRVPVPGCIDLVECVSPIHGLRVPRVPTMFAPTMGREQHLRHVSRVDPGSVAPYGPSVFPDEHAPYLSHEPSHTTGAAALDDEDVVHSGGETVGLLLCSDEAAEVGVLGTLVSPAAPVAHNSS